MTPLVRFAIVTTLCPWFACSKPDAPLGSVAADENDANKISALQRKLSALEPAEALPPSDSQKRLAVAVDNFFNRNGTHRHYLHLDKPLYKPGETIWFRAFELATHSLMSSGDASALTVHLINPRGATVKSKRLQVQSGVAHNDFIIPAQAEGGEYTLRVDSSRGSSWQRSVIVSQYQPPRIKKKAEFLRKAYGPGDSVTTAVSLARATGEALTAHTGHAVVVVDQVEVARLPFRTDQSGNAVVKFDLPKSFAVGDGLLTLLVNDGGVTESLQKRIPIVMKKLALDVFPEGGQLVAGLPGRVYFRAQNAIGKPADVAGRVIDDKGAEVARFRSLHNGLGRFEITPALGRSYRLEVSEPANIETVAELPKAQEKGCVLHAIDDFDSRRKDVRVGVFCSEAQEVIATASLREKKLLETLVRVPAREPAVVSMPVAPGTQGAIRVTLFNHSLAPLAERLVYRGRGQDLSVEIRADSDSYSPRDAVTLTVETKDSAGRPVETDLSVAVVDDTVLSFADDKTAHMLARFYLEAEMPGQEIEEPNFYFSDDPKASAALDLVLGTQGWRRFEWQQVIAPTITDKAEAVTENEDAVFAADEPMPEAMAPQMEAEKPGKAIEPPRNRPARPKLVLKDKELAAGPMADEAAIAGQERMNRARGRAAEKRDMGGWAGDQDHGMVVERWAFAPVRVFPAPNYQAGYDGPRTDFRETIHWAPQVKTGKDGIAKVRFHVSDSITSFRATAEGVSMGGLPGRAETLVQSKLPVSLVVKMPLEVSAGDTIRLPVTLQNETEREYRVRLHSEFGPAYKVNGGIPKSVKLAAKERQSFFAELAVVGTGADPKDGAMRVSMETANLRDEVSRKISVVPLGFPQVVSVAGTLKAKAEHTVTLEGALPGSIEASLTMYPSPLATMVSGTAGMLREPSGCFEQASSSNYPNIMILGYLEEHDSVDPALVARTQGMLDRGYKKLIGYESPEKGYEWFGGDPGHEALTAYGLMEFADMAPVYGDVDRGMVKRTAAWLKSRRDGKGGFKKNSRALDSFGRASDDVTNGYIAYALSEAGENDLAAELKRQRHIARTSKDHYLLALAANTLANLEPKSSDTSTALSKLANLQGKEGAWTGADHSITRSGGTALHIETTALAAMALLKGGQAHQPNVRRAVDWLNKNRSGFGNFSSTQATILSLKAMTSYARESRQTQASGVATLVINGKQAGRLRFDKGHREPLVFEDMNALLRPGQNKIELRLDSKTSLPYSMAIHYRTRQPASSPETKVDLETSLSKSKVPLGEGVRMNVTIANKTSEGIPMTLARVGIPGGLTFQTWQLKELKDKKLIDFYETHEREVVLYFRSMAPNARKEIPLELIARVPGQYTAPASRGYLYYTDEFKDWVEPAKVTVE